MMGVVRVCLGAVRKCKIGLEILQMNLECCCQTGGKCVEFRNSKADKVLHKTAEGFVESQ